MGDTDLAVGIHGIVVAAGIADNQFSHQTAFESKTFHGNHRSDGNINVIKQIGRGLRKISFLLLWSL